MQQAQSGFGVMASFGAAALVGLLFVFTSISPTYASKPIRSVKYGIYFETIP